MKKNIFIATFAALLLGACSNEINLIDTPKDIPIVHGFLSRVDTAQYLRIEKAFIDPAISATELAKDPKNLYFDNITVELIDVEAKKTYVLNKVDGNLEGYKRNTGVFADSPNYLYKIKTSKIDLGENKAFKLVIKKSDNTILTEAQTIVTPDLILNEDRTNPKALPFAGTCYLSWLQSEYKTAKMYDIALYINIKETNATSGKSEQKRLKWNLIKNFVPGQTEITPQVNSIQYRIPDPFGFYKFLSQNLTPDKNILRLLNGIDLEVYSGGQELFDFQSVGNINSGITGTEVIPKFTNLSNGYGILTSRNKMFVENMEINARSLDSLRKGQFTKTLNFQ